MKKLNPSLALVTLLSLIGQNSVSAAIINSTFSGTADFGPLTGESYSGTTIFDDSSLSGVGDELIPTTQFELTFNGETFNNENAEASGEAEAVYVDGIFAGIQYKSQTINDLFVVLVAGAFDTDDASFTYELSGVQGSGSITYNQNGVSTPEPSLILSLLGVGAMGFLRKRS